MKTKILGLLAVGALAIPVGGNAAAITGAISLNGFFDAIFPSGSTSIVSQLTTVVSQQPGLAGGGFGDYAGSFGLVTPIATIVLGAVAPGAQPLYTFADGTRFFAQSLTDLVRTPLACDDNLRSCSDVLEFLLIGEVTRANFNATPATVRWVGQGSCVGSGGVCASDPTASWSAGLESPIATDVPEPGTVALLGLGLLGLGVSRRRKAA